jgi:osmoprotectant transport system substrate-binding protein
VLVGLLALASLVACGVRDESSEPTLDDGVRIASFDFAESELLAELYAALIEDAGVPVVRLGPIGPREVLAPALESGVVDVVPEYVGTASGYFGAEAASVDALRDAAASRGLTVLSPASAENVNVVVVTKSTAEVGAYRQVSDLADMASTAVFGGPVECPERPLCLLGLREIYGLEFAEFIPQRSLADTAEALRRGEIDVGLMFSTAAELSTDEFVPLDDDRMLQPPENVVPIIRSAAVEQWGTAVPDALEQLSLRLTTAQLRLLNRAVADGRPAGAVAADWLTAVGLVED